MISYIYLAIFVLSVLFIKLYLANFVKQHGIHYMSFFILAGVSILNYYFLSIADTSAVALIAQKNIYAVMLFFPIVFISILCDLCGAQRKIFQNVITGFAFVLIMAIITTEQTGLFYKDYILDPITMEVSKSYGKFHSIYYIYILVWILMTFSIIYEARKKNSFPKTAVSMIVVMEFVIVLSTFLKDITGINFNFEVVGILIADVLMLKLSAKIPLYDTQASIVERVEEEHSVGVAIADENMRVLGYNETMCSYFPDFKDVRVDYVLPDSFQYKSLFEDMAKDYDKTEKVIRRELLIDDQWYSFKMAALILQGRRRGYQMFVHDITEKNGYIKQLEIYRKELMQDVDKKVTQINRMQEASLLGIAELIESRDGSTGGHVKRTSKVVGILTNYLLENHTFQVSPVFYAIIEKVAPLHDVGKIAVDDAVLRKPGKFTPEEFEQMKQHAPMGGEIIKKILNGIENDDWIDIAYNIASYHHERWDGSGYPKHLAGKDIPLEARIMAIADVYDALVSKRCYKEEFDFRKACHIIIDGMGTQFDPELKECFCTCVPKLEAYYTELKRSEEA